MVKEEGGEGKEFFLILFSDDYAFDNPTFMGFFPTGFFSFLFFSFLFFSFLFFSLLFFSLLF